MSKPTIEAQVAAVGKALDTFNFSVADRKALADAEGTLKALAAMRTTLVKSLNENSDKAEVIAWLSSEITTVLGWPPWPSDE